jgi:hypothetical protein
MYRIQMEQKISLDFSGGTDLQGDVSALLMPMAGDQIELYTSA